MRAKPSLSTRRVGTRCVTGRPPICRSRRVRVRSPVARSRSVDGLSTFTATSIVPARSSSVAGSRMPRRTAGVTPVAVACNEAGIDAGAAGVERTRASGIEPVALSVAPSYAACPSRNSMVSFSRCACTRRSVTVDRSSMATDPGPALTSATTTGLSSVPVTRARAASGPEASVTGNFPRRSASTARAASPMSPFAVSVRSPEPSMSGSSPDADSRVAPALTCREST